MNQLSIICLAIGLFVLSACAPKTQEVTVASSSDVTKREFKAFWISSSKGGSQNTKKGLMTWDDCYLINTNAALEKSETGAYEILSYDFSDNLIWCEAIDHFNYEEGHVYKVHGTLTYKKNELSGIYVDEILSKEEDVHFQKVDIFDMYVGPEMIEDISFHGQKISCHQVMYSNEPRSGDWESYCGQIGGLDYEPGYLYKVRVKRIHISEFERSVLSDSHGYSDQVVFVYKKQLMP